MMRSSRGTEPAASPALPPVPTPVPAAPVPTAPVLVAGSNDRVDLAAAGSAAGSADELADGVAPGELLRASLEVALAALPDPLVLAVSGGCDSMALLYAMARWAPGRIAAVATFDHGTGAFATEAASLVAAQARKLGLTVVRERSRTLGHSEAAWRDARWQFLRRIARGFQARIATAHTRDDQLETIVMRALRGSGARGLAALAAPSSVVRPWLGVSRTELARWVAGEGLPFLDDPMNSSSRYLRGRVRHQLLPALEAASPGFRDAMLAVGERAAAWRRDVDALLDASGLTLSHRGTRLIVLARLLEQTTPDGRAVLWPALCARVGVTLDAHGTRAAVRFSTNGRLGAHITLAGGATILRRRDGRGDVFEVRCPGGSDATPPCWHGGAEALPARFGGWRFRRLGVEPLASDTWSIGLPEGAAVVVRTWKRGDRIRTAGAPAGRRVTRYLSELQVPVLDRSSWPVVLIGDELAWIPGICRGLAAPSRPGRPDLIWYRCEREFD
ncbi:MAG: tRNA lysidine(34) synthetase TilS [Gemmatimonas sp.]|uniref:tRNA lysidine(34) synthetase TilS n=2 Tax=Gemmatimonas sp. TaxID=1962908 RepID=UPI00391EFE93|nr:tRNA lysidine(34) synthetase TilS [Gemmatimonadota bacterium]